MNRLTLKSSKSKRRGQIRILGLRKKLLQIRLIPKITLQSIQTSQIHDELAQSLFDYWGKWEKEKKINLSFPKIAEKKSKASLKKRSFLVLFLPHFLRNQHSDSQNPTQTTPDSIPYQIEMEFPRELSTDQVPDPLNSLQNRVIEVVDNPNRESLTQQLYHSVSADESGTTGDENRPIVQRHCLEKKRWERSREKEWLRKQCREK